MKASIVSTRLSASAEASFEASTCVSAGLEISDMTSTEIEEL
jgi:hypothetical protein